ncbi:MAG: right-handed parallel beta-helix repeat-containing protein [Desulfobulbaceae bacterium]|nr:right-handed parallel beta-helix repeat-containing protein [Desulfobulbaceae bacterium]
MKKIAAINCLSIAFLLILSTNTLFAFDTTITGKSDSSYDVKAVQDAVDKGGSVLLKGTFDFGKKGRVNIKNDVEISGEIDEAGRYLTKVVGGFWTFHSPLPSTELPIPTPGPKVKIEKIHFDGATRAPLHFAYTSGIEILNNKITNVLPLSYPYKWKGGDNLLLNAGILLGNRFVHMEKILPGAVTGRLIFNNNSVDLKCKKPEITMGQGVYSIYTWGAIIEIKGNTFRNVSRNSIETLDNYVGDEGKGNILIADNNIVTPPVGIPFPSPKTPNGIMVGWFLNKSGGSDPALLSKISIVRNYVQANGETSLGIASLADGVSVLGNHVEVGGGAKSIGIFQVGSNGFIARNKIDGSGAWALNVGPYKVYKGNGNTLAWNDFTDFEGSSGDFYSGGNKNTFVGAKCSIVNKGEGNILLTQ